MQIEIVERLPSPEEYNRLRAEVGWGVYERAVIEGALPRSLYSVCAYDGATVGGATPGGATLAGMARIIGDGGLVYSVQDVIVRPAYQGQGIGTALMDRVMASIRAHASHNSIIGLMSAQGKERFYERYGFVARPTERLGSGMTMYWKTDQQTESARTLPRSSEDRVGLSMPDRDRPIIGLLSPAKLVSLAQYAGLGPGQRVLDLGCGYGEVLLAWAQHFDISGVGVDADPAHIEWAKKAAANTPYADRLEYVCADATQYAVDRPTRPGFDLAACINATNMFGQADAMFRNAIRHMKQAIRDGGYLLIAEPYYRTADVPQALIDYEGPLQTEADLIRTIYEEGFELVQMAHSDRNDWDRYISSNMYHAIRWLKENPAHPDRQRRLESHRRWQEMYVTYREKLQASVALLMTTV